MKKQTRKTLDLILWIIGLIAAGLLIYNIIRIII